MVHDYISILQISFPFAVCLLNSIGAVGVNQRNLKSLNIISAFLFIIINLVLIKMTEASAENLFSIKFSNLEAIIISNNQEYWIIRIFISVLLLIGVFFEDVKKNLSSFYLYIGLFNIFTYSSGIFQICVFLELLFLVSLFMKKAEKGEYALELAAFSTGMILFALVSINSGKFSDSGLIVSIALAFSLIIKSRSFDKLNNQTQISQTIILLMLRFIVPVIFVLDDSIRSILTSSSLPLNIIAVIILFFGLVFKKSKYTDLVSFTSHMAICFIALLLVSIESPSGAFVLYSIYLVFANLIYLIFKQKINRNLGEMRNFIEVIIIYFCSFMPYTGSYYFFKELSLGLDVYIIPMLVIYLVLITSVQWNLLKKTRRELTI